MPIYEYRCRTCRTEFEELVRGGATPPCPSCGACDPERLLSLPTVKSESTHDLALRAARRRDKAQGHERVQEQIRYEQSHED